MSSANVEMLERAAVALGGLVDDEVVFVGRPRVEAIIAAARA